MLPGGATFEIRQQTDREVLQFVVVVVVLVLVFVLVLVLVQTIDSIVC